MYVRDPVRLMRGILNRNVQGGMILRDGMRLTFLPPSRSKMTRSSMDRSF